MMSKFSQKCLKVSVISLFIGALLLGAGFAMGGIQAIKSITAPQKVSEVFTDISELRVDTYRNIHIQSGDVQKPTVSYYKKSTFLSDIELTKEGDLLSIKNVEKEFEMTGLIEVFGYLLNESGRTSDFREIVVTLPKDKPLEALTGWSMWMQLTNLTIENIDYQGSFTGIVNSTISKGNLQGSISANDSKLKDVKLNLYSDYSQFTNSSGENLVITDQSGGINFSNSTLKNISYSDGSTEEEIQKEAELAASSNGEDNYYGYESQVTIENVKLLGENHFMASAINMDINLAADSKTNVDIQSYRGDIQLSGRYKDLKKVSENTGTRVSYTEKDATGKIIILNSYGNISMK